MPHHPVDLHLDGYVDHDDRVEASRPARSRRAAGCRGRPRRPAGAAASISAARARTRGWMIASSARRRSGSAKTRAPSAGRSRPPSGPSTSGPNSSTTAASPSVPRRHHLAGQQVGVDDDGAELGEDRRHGALARGHAPGQADTHRRAHWSTRIRRIRSSVRRSRSRQHGQEPLGLLAPHPVDLGQLGAGRLGRPDQRWPGGRRGRAPRSTRPRASSASTTSVADRARDAQALGEHRRAHRARTPSRRRARACDGRDVGLGQRRTELAAQPARRHRSAGLPCSSLTGAA